MGLREEESRYRVLSSHGHAVNDVSDYNQALDRYEHRQRLFVEALFSMKVDKGFRGGLDFTDVALHTNLRLLQIICAAFAWRANISDDHPNNVFDRLIHSGETIGGFTFWEWVAGLGFTITLPLGAARSCVLIDRELVKHGEKYVANRILEIQERNFKKQGTIETVLKEIEIKNQHVLRKQWTRAQAAFVSPSKVEEKVEKHIAIKHPFIQNIMDATKWPLASFLAFTNKHSIDVATIFWPVWFIFATMYGLTALGTSLTFSLLPVVTVLTVAIFAGFKLYVWKNTPTDMAPNSANETLEEKIIRQKREHDDEIMNHIQGNKHLHVFLKLRHAINLQKTKAVLESLLSGSELDAVKSIFVKLYPEEFSKEEFNKENEPAKATLAKRSMRTQQKPSNKYSFLGKILDFSQGHLFAKYAANIVMDMIGDATGALFKLWFASALLFSLGFALNYFAASMPLLIASFVLTQAVPALTFFSTMVLFDPVISISIACFAALLAIPFSYAAQKKDYLKYQATAKYTLGLPYRPDKNDFRTKEVVFNELSAKVKRQIATVQSIQNTLKKKRVQSQAFETMKEHVLSYDLEEANVSNNYFFEELQARPSFAVKVDDASTLFYKFLGGAQTFIFNARMVGLDKGVLAPIVTALGAFLFGASGGMIMFFILSAVVGTIGGFLKVRQHQLNTEYAQKQKSLNKLDGMIRALREVSVELDYLDKLYQLAKPQANNGSRVSHAPVNSPAKNGFFQPAAEMHTPRAKAGAVLAAESAKPTPFSFIAGANHTTTSQEAAQQVSSSSVSCPPL